MCSHTEDGSLPSGSVALHWRLQPPEGSPSVCRHLGLSQGRTCHWCLLGEGGEDRSTSLKAQGSLNDKWHGSVPAVPTMRKRPTSTQKDQTDGRAQGWRRTVGTHKSHTGDPGFKSWLCVWLLPPLAAFRVQTSRWEFYLSAYLRVFLPASQINYFFLKRVQQALWYKGLSYHLGCPHSNPASC